MADVSHPLTQRAPTFFALTQASFRFLEEQYGYQLESTTVADLQYVLDTRASVSYLGERVAVGVTWMYAEGYISVGFVELRTPWVRPAEANGLRTDLDMPLGISLDTLATMEGHAKDPDFLLHGRGLLGRRSMEACRRLVDTNMADVVEGLARATRRYAADILAGDTSRFPEAVRFHAQDMSRP
jgi:hypothetical protein